MKGAWKLQHCYSMKQWESECHECHCSACHWQITETTSVTEAVSSQRFVYFIVYWSENMTNSCNSCTGAVLYLCISWSLNSASNSLFGNASKRFEDETLEGSQLQPPGVVSLALMWQCSRHVARIVFRQRLTENYRNRCFKELWKK